MGDQEAVSYELGEHPEEGRYGQAMARSPGPKDTRAMGKGFYISRSGANGPLLIALLTILLCFVGRQAMAQSSAARPESPPGSIAGPLDSVSPQAHLLLRNGLTNRWQSYTMDGLTVTSSGEIALPISANIQPVGRADTDGDAIGDVLLRNESSGAKSGQFQSFCVVGQTVTGNAVLDTIRDLDYAVISSDDFDGDGRGDLLLRNGAGAWLLYEIDGVTALSSGTPSLPTHSSLVPRATGDFNGDLRADVLMRRGNGTWQLHLLDGRFMLDKGQPALPGLSVWQILAVADYNADGRADLLMRRGDTGLWKLFLMDGATVIEERQVIRNYKPLNFQFRSAADFNGDGRADILIRNTDETGIWRLFLMDGTTIIGKGVVDILRSARYGFIDARDLNGDSKADVIIRRDDGQWHATLMDGLDPSPGAGFIALKKDLAWSLITSANNPPLIIGQASLTTPEETPLTITLDDLIVSDPDNIYPNGFRLTVLPGAGYSITGHNEITPNAQFTGDISAPVTVNDGINDSVPFDLRVAVTAVNDVPVIIGQAPLSTPEETPLIITLDDLMVSDPDNYYPDDFALTVLPGAGYGITGPNEITPGAEFAGDLDVPVTVSDGIDDSVPFDLRVTVTAVNDPPVIIGQETLTTPEETPLTITLADLMVSDPDNIYPDDFALTVLPGAGYGITGPNEITPGAEFAGDLDVPVTVSDGVDDSVPYDLLVTVTAVNDPPVIIGQETLTTPEETPLTITLADLTVSDPDSLYPDDFTLTVLPGATYTITGPSEITPTAEFAGALSAPVVVSDGIDDSAPFGLVVVVTAVNDTPVITGQMPLITPEETPLTITLGDLTVSDPDNVYPTDFTLTVLPGSGYGISGPNEITPEAEFAGDLSVPATVCDGIDDSVPFDLRVTVTAVNDPPVIVGQETLATPEETPLSITLDDLTVSDPDNVYPDEFTLTVLPGAGYSITGPNEITPQADFTGELSVPVTVSDGIDHSAPFDLLVTVEYITPHIVMIMLDDLDERTLQDALSAGLMPNLQTHIVDGAIEFTESYVTNPICCPSRASFLSGLYSHNHGAVHNFLIYPGRGFLGAVGVFDDSDTIATRMQSLGYTTGHIGKYLNGYGGFPLDADISPAFEPSYVPPGWTEWHGTVDPYTYCVYNYRINHNGVVASYDLPEGQTESSEIYQTHVLADVAERFVETYGSGGAPFFLAIMPIAPHWESCKEVYDGQPLPADIFARRIRPAPEDLTAPVPAFVPSPAYNEDTSDKPDFLAGLPALTRADLSNLTEQYQVRVRSLISVDRLIGRLIAALGPAVEDTVLIFTSDNGWLYGEYRQGGKVYAYDASAKVPLYIRMPGATVAEQRANLVINNDLAPTILNMAAPGYPDTDFDGRTFAPLLADPEPSGWVERRHFLIEHHRTLNTPAQDAFPTYFALRSRTTLYIESFGGIYTQTGPLIGLELYDVISDPYYLQSLIRHPEDPPDPVLNGYVEALKTCVGETCKDGENAAP